ncbi:MAG: L,D-transpeptidase, partial [Pseudarthrobacter sp.]
MPRSPATGEPPRTVSTPRSIGRAVSSGCIRMLNEDVAVLYESVPVGTPVVVLGGSATG